MSGTVLCQICQQRPATNHVVELADGGEGGEGHRALHICQHCVKELSIDLTAAPPSVAGILALAQDQAGGAKPADAPAAKPKAKAKAPYNPVCPDCGLGFAEFSQHNRFGCAGDYAAWGGLVSELLEQVHGSSRHLGRTPANRGGPADERNRRIAERLRLEKALAKAISEEAYERAARLRDQIKALNQLDPAPPGGAGDA